MTSKKVQQWRWVSKMVEDHIENYVVPQYGDFPDKTIAKFTPIKVQAKLEAYVDRIGRSSRGPEDAARDALKIAHFAGYLAAMYMSGIDDAQWMPPEQV